MREEVNQMIPKPPSRGRTLTFTGDLLCARLTHISRPNLPANPVRRVPSFPFPR